MNQPIIEMDAHGMNVEQAISKLEKTINAADNGVYRVRVIHGYHRGTRIRNAIYRELGHGLNPRVLRIVPGDNEGITELILREYW